MSLLSASGHCPLSRVATLGPGTAYLRSRDTALYSLSFYPFIPLSLYSGSIRGAAAAARAAMIAGGRQVVPDGSAGHGCARRFRLDPQWIPSQWILNGFPMDPRWIPNGSLINPHWIPAAFPLLSAGCPLCFPVCHLTPTMVTLITPPRSFHPLHSLAPTAQKFSDICGSQRGCKAWISEGKGSDPSRRQL